jgi:hypothetical protein
VSAHVEREFLYAQQVAAHKDTTFPKAEHLNDDDDLHDDDHLFRPRQGGEVYWLRKHGTFWGLLRVPRLVRYLCPHHRVFIP